MLVSEMKPFIPQELPLEEVAWEPLIPLIGKANWQLAEYNGVLTTLPNPELLLAPLTTQEAVLSSKIEGTQATLGEVLKFEAGQEPEQESRRQDIREIMNYRRALREAEEELKTRPFNLNLLLRLHATLLDSVRGRNKARGHFRVEQNWIGAPDSKIEEAQFIPPAPGELLLKALYNWESYYHLQRPDTLVQLAIVHAQFEILHPFLDGNGRLGRILIPIFLCERGLLSQPVFYMSEYFESNRDQYVEKLRSLGKIKDAWNHWVEFFLEGLIQQAKDNVVKARQIHNLYEELKRQILDLTHSQFAVPLLDNMFEQPIFRSSHLGVKANMPSKPTVINMLGRLKKFGILKTVAEGRGPHGYVYALAKLVNLCEGKEVV
jgi:Fic family protein